MAGASLNPILLSMSTSIPAKLLFMLVKGWYNNIDSWMLQESKTEPEKPIHLMDRITFSKKPDLNSPYLIAAFAGWPDAAGVATRSVDYIVSKLKAKKFAEMDSEEFIDFNESRPMIVVDEGILQRLSLPRNDFYYRKSEGNSHDIILLRGTEPQLKWKTFSRR